MQYAKLNVCVRLSSLLLSAVFLSCINPSEASFNHPMTEGISEFTNGNYGAAEKLFTKASNWSEVNGSSEQTVSALGYLGRAQDENGSIQEAEESLWRRFEIARGEKLSPPNRIETFLALSIFYAKHKRCDQLQNLIKTFDNESSEIKLDGTYLQTRGLMDNLFTVSCQLPT